MDDRKTKVEKQKKKGDGSSRVKRKGNIEIIESKNFFSIEAKTLYLDLPQTNKFAGMCEDAARLWLLMNYRAGLKKNHVWVGVDDADKQLGFTSVQYTQAADELDRNHYTRRSPCNSHPGQWYCRDILNVPIYDSVAGTFSPHPDTRSTKYSRTDMRFVRVPDGVFSHFNNLTLREIKVLLKLYEYNSLQEFGGVNPSKVEAIGPTGPYRVNPSVYTDIGLTEKYFVQSLNSLLRKGHFKVVRVVAIPVRLMSDAQRRYLYDDKMGAGNGYVSPAIAITMMVIRPRYQIKSDVLAWLSILTERGVDINGVEQYIT